MKHKLFFFAWLALLSFCFLVVGVLALVGYPHAEIIFWSRKTIESEAGKITWIVISAICLIIFSLLTLTYNRDRNT